MYEELIEYASRNLPYLPGFLEGAIIAIEVTVLAILCSWVCGLFAALAKLSSNPVFRAPATFYIWFIRGTPTLIQVFIVYFGLPALGLRLSPLVAGVLALGIGEGAYIAEIVRSGLKAIPRGQFESAAVLGLSRRHTMFRIIIPQVVRIILPALTNEAITTLKNSSLLSTITVVELTLHTQMMIAQTFRPFEFYALAAVLYLLMTTALTFLFRRIEKRYTFSI